MNEISPTKTLSIIQYTLKRNKRELETGRNRVRQRKIEKEKLRQR